MYSEGLIFWKQLSNRKCQRSTLYNYSFTTWKAWLCHSSGSIKLKCRTAPDGAMVVNNITKCLPVSWKRADYGHKVHFIFFLSTEAQHIYLHLESGQLLSFLIQLYVIYASHQNSFATGSTGLDAFGGLFISQNKVSGKTSIALPDCCKIQGTAFCGTKGSWIKGSQEAFGVLLIGLNWLKRTGIQVILQKESLLQTRPDLTDYFCKLFKTFY